MKRLHENDGYVSDIDMGTEDLQNKRRKITKLETKLGYKLGVTNKIRDGLIDPSPLVQNCNPDTGFINWMCNSSSPHQIKMEIENGKIIFSCDCSSNKEKNRYCRHINAIILKICLDYIDGASKFNLEKEQKIIIDRSLKGIISSISSILIN